MDVEVEQRLSELQRDVGELRAAIRRRDREDNETIAALTEERESIRRTLVKLDEDEAQVRQRHERAVTEPVVEAPPLEDLHSLSSRLAWWVFAASAALLVVLDSVLLRRRGIVLEGFTVTVLSVVAGWLAARFLDRGRDE